MSIESLDRAILGEYLRDARQSYREIARKVGVSPGTVLSRVKKLEQAGIIKGYAVLVDPEKLGYELTVLTEITVSKGKLVEMEREIAKLPYVCAVYDVTGLTDAIVVARFHNREELNRFTKTVLAMPFVERTNTHLVLTTVKEDFRLV